MIESFRYIERNIDSRNPELRRILREDTIYGNEITNTARITKMNMILAGDGHSNIHMKDSLANPTYLDLIEHDKDGNIVRDKDGNIQYSSEYRGLYDVVITNMPYSQRTKHGSLYDLPSTNGDSICVQHCMKAINSAAPDGRMALVVPEGFLFRKDLTKTREYLLNHCQLQSIISLPQGVFLPYTGVKTDIIYATKVNQKIKPSEQKKDFWYFDVKSDGYTLDNHRRKLDTTSDLSKYEEYRKLDKDQMADMLKVGFEKIPLDKVRQNSSILVGSRYRTLEKANANHPMVQLGDGELFHICSGGTPSSSVPEYWNGNVSWITLADLPAENCITEIKTTERTISEAGLNNSNAKLLPVETVIVSTRATIGRIGIARTQLATNQGFKNIIIKRPDVILPKYLAYMLTAKVDTMKHLASGATFKEISKENFCTIQIPLLPIDQQRSVVNELDGYQNIVSGAQNILRNYMPSVSPCNEYRTDSLGNLFGPVLDSIDPSSQNGTVCYIGLENIVSGTGEFTGCLENRYENIKSLKRVFKEGDILFGKLRPALNKVAVATFDGICSTDIIVLRAKRKDILSEYYAVLLRGADFNKTVLNGVSGGQLPRVDLNYLMDIPVKVVPIEEQQQSVDSFRTEKDMMDSAKQIISVFSEKIDRRIKGIWGE